MNKYNLLSIIFVNCVLSYSLKADCIDPQGIINDIDGVKINAHGGTIIPYNGKYYWFGEKRTNGVKNEGKVQLYISTNLKEWSNGGVALDLSNLDGEYSIERPKVIYNNKTKKYVMWFHLELHGKYNTGMAGVATSNNIIGPYNLISQFSPNKGIEAKNSFYSSERTDFKNKADENYRGDLPKGQMFRDFTLFKDDDGKAYAIYESEGNFSLQVAELNSTYTGFDGVYTRILVGGKNEAPAVIKRNGEYYLFTSGLNGYHPTAARLSISKNIFGPWITIGSPIQSNNIREVKNSFYSQGAFIFKVINSDRYVFSSDQWDPKNLKDSKYLFLPVQWANNTPYIKWENCWSDK